MEEVATRPPEPPRVAPFWLILQRLDDVRREQDRLRQHVDERIDEVRREQDRLRQHVDERLQEVRREQERLRQETGELRQELKELRQEMHARTNQLAGWFIAGLVAVLGAVGGMGWVVSR